MEDFRFVWKKKQHEKIHLQLEATNTDIKESTKAQESGHQTIIISKEFFCTIPFISYLNNKLTHYRIFSILFIIVREYFCKVLINFNTSKNQPIAHRQESILENHKK